MKPASCAILTATISVLAASGLRATMILPASLDQCAEAAETVVRGVVESVETRPAEGVVPVFTVTLVRIEEAFRETVSKALVEVVTPGGEYGGIRARVPGAPEVGPAGTEVVLFLHPDDGRPRLTNVVFWQGLYHVEEGRVRENGLPAPVFLDRVREAVARTEAAASPDGKGRRAPVSLRGER